MADNGNQTDDRVLDALFDSAKREAPPLDPAFHARLSADMEGMAPRTAPRQSAPAMHEGFFHRFLAVFAASGLTGAAAIGFWIVFLFPEVLNTMTSGFDATGTYGISAFLPADDLAALE